MKRKHAEGDDELHDLRTLRHAVSFPLIARLATQNDVASGSVPPVAYLGSREEVIPGHLVRRLLLVAVEAFSFLAFE